MNLPNITYRNQTIEDRTTYNSLPSELKEFYQLCNGLVALNGGVQFRGCLKEPKWISLYDIWKGPSKLVGVYESVKQTDIPIAQDAFGDQYFYRNGTIWKLNGESGYIESQKCTLEQFIINIENNPYDYLSLHQIYELREMDIKLKNGEMMNVYPPFMFKAENKRSYKPVSVSEQISFLKKLYTDTKDLKDGQAINIKIE